MSGINEIRVAPNFMLREFECKDGSHQVVLHAGLLHRLQKLRELVNRPVIITSGYRNLEHNKRIGGHPNSLHLKGMAADLAVSGLSPDNLAILARQAGFARAIVYKGHLHVDLGGP